jgi:hypothetical protein
MKLPRLVLAQPFDEIEVVNKEDGGSGENENGLEHGL